jgi:hypothetical protein
MTEQRNIPTCVLKRESFLVFKNAISFYLAAGVTPASGDISTTGSELLIDLFPRHIN